jgi:hypothetical protein
LKKSSGCCGFYPLNLYFNLASGINKLKPAEFRIQVTRRKKALIEWATHFGNFLLTKFPELRLAASSYDQSAWFLLRNYLIIKQQTI